MTDKIREEVRSLFARKQLNQSEVAKEIGVSRVYLNSVINGKHGHVPDVWILLMKYLGQEIMMIPKDKVGDVKRVLVD